MIVPPELELNGYTGDYLYIDNKHHLPRENLWRGESTFVVGSPILGPKGGLSESTPMHGHGIKALTLGGIRTKLQEHSMVNPKTKKEYRTSAPRPNGHKRLKATEVEKLIEAARKKPEEKK